MAKQSEPKGPKPPLPGLVVHRFFFTGPGTPQPVANILFYTHYSDGINHSQADLQVVATTVRSAFQGDVWPYLSNSWTLQFSQSLSKGGDGLEFTTTGAPQVGGAQGSFPPQCAVCISWHSTATWRGGKPRTYLPGVPTTALPNSGSGALSSSFCNSIATGALAMLGIVNGLTTTGATPTMGFPSYYTKYQFRPVPLFFPFTSLNVHQRLDSQRRRTGKERYFALT